MHSMRTGRPWAFVVSLSLMLSLGGCDFMKKLKKQEAEAEAETNETAQTAEVQTSPLQKAGPRQGGPSSVAAPPGTAAPNDPDQALSNKLNLPIDCINGISMGVSRSHERYLAWVKDAKVGPTGGEQNVYGLYQLLPHQIESCKKALSLLGSTPEPATPALDKAAADYAAKLGVVAPLVDEAYKYYDLKNFKDDAFAKAKSMHGPLIAAFEAFDASATAMHDEVTKLKSGLAERELDRIEKTEGKKLAWHRHKLMILAKAVLDAGADEDAKIDVAKLEKTVKDLEDIETAMEAYAKANPGEAEAMFTMFQSEAQDFLKAAKALHRRLRDKTPYSRGDVMMLERNSGWMVEGSQDKMVRAYNELVGKSNSLNTVRF